MQIKSLYIKDYKMLKNFRMEFNQPVSLLIGQNGSGKSTVLEALAWILRGAYLHFIENKSERVKFEFELCYEIAIEEAIIDISSLGNPTKNSLVLKLKCGRAKPQWSIESNTKNYKTDDIIKSLGYKKLLPTNILIYYAGWFETMKHICQPFEDDYRYRLRTKAKSSYEGYNNLEAIPMLYIENHHFPMLLASLFAFQYNTNIDTFFTNKIGISNNSFIISIIVKKRIWKSEKKDDYKDFWGAEGVLLRFLNTFIEIIKEHSEDKSIQYDDIYNYEKEFYTFDFSSEAWYIVTDNFIEEKKIFYLLNMLSASDMLGDLRITMNKTTNKPISHHSLSEGEQQLITIIAINELLIEDNTLLLFDEPDTYLHPSWQREFLKNVESVMDDSNAHLIVTSHSPMMIANMKKGDLFKMENGQAHFIEGGYFGKDYGFTLETQMDTSTRNEETKQELETLFEFIETDKFNEANNLLEILHKKYPNEPELTRAQTMITLLTD